MAKYRKKPVVIDAVQWTGHNLDEVVAFGAPVEGSLEDPTELIIATLEDGVAAQVKHAVSLNDWVIRGIAGEYYACKPDIFVRTYDLVEEPVPA